VKVGPTADRVAELARFIETLTERFKANESLFATRLEVSERELALLRALVREGPMITRELGGRFGVPVSTMTGLMDRMEKKGLVVRGRDPNDERRVVVSLSPGGHALRKRTKEMLGEFYCYLSVPVDELEDLRDRLHRFTTIAGPSTSTSIRAAA